MGLHIGFSSCRESTCCRSTPQDPICPNKEAVGNPNPRWFSIKQVQKVGDFLVARILYPDCKNFEGMKILVFEHLTEKALRSLSSIDPHFCEEGHIAPIARFVPTQRGWRMAICLCKALNTTGT